MTRPVQSLNRAFGWRLASPILFLPWIWTQFFASAISWFFIALYSVWTWNVTFYYIPIWSMGAFFLLAPFQESQVPVIGILEFLADEIDNIMNDTIFPGIEDLFYIVQPGCWGYNFLWDGAVALFRIAIFDPIKLLLNMVIPTLPPPFPAILDSPLSTSGFPLTIEISTSSSPDWIVGPYGRSVGRARPEDLAHSLLDGSRRIDPSDPAAQALVRWLRQAGHHATDDPTVLLVPFAVPDELLNLWTHPNTPEYRRRSISERMLRRAMDRSLGIEEPGWWEGPPPGQDPSQPHRTALQTSPWNRVFEIPNEDITGMGVVRMDNLPDLKAVYGEARTRGVQLLPGTVAYRFLADAKGTRDLNFEIFQKVAFIFNFFFDAIATVLAELWEIMLFVADFLFGNLETFFNNAIEFVANVFNQVWAELLGLPCLKFDSIAVFAISLLDCICGPLQQLLGQGAITTWFDYSRPADLSELPQAVLNCVGLACIDVATITDPKQFATNLLGGCMQLPDIVVCCVIDPFNCFINTVIDLTNCPCAGSINVSPPSCDYESNSGDEWLRCIVIWIINEVLAEISSDNCGVTTCEDIGDLADSFIECVALSVLEVNNFVDAILSLVGDIFGGDDGGFLSSVVSAISFGRTPRESANERSDQGLDDAYIRTQATFDPRAKYSRDAPWTEDGAGGRGRSGVRTPHDRLEELRASDPHFMQTLIQANRYRSEESGVSKVPPGDVRVDNATAQMVTEVARGYGEVAGARVLAMVRAQQEAKWRAFYEGANPSRSELDAMVAAQSSPTEWNALGPRYDHDDFGTKGNVGVPMIHQLSHLVGRESKARRRAEIQVRVDRLVYSNPFLRQATWRAVEILRDLQDFAELRMFGPDPFALPPRDADPTEDPRVYATSARYIDETVGQNGAYAFHKTAIHDSPYYAGLYKMLFQLGGADEIARGPNGTDGNAESWEAMAEHRNNPLFHLGRIMSASRQAARAMTEVAREVWWDPDTFGFHFPNYPQIYSILVRSHLPAYLDDMRDSFSGLLRSHDDRVNHLLMSKAVEYTDQVQRDPESVDHLHGGPAHTYSWLVQAEVAIRTVATRLLSPRHIDAMLDEISTRSPLHARYAAHMRARVHELRDDSPHDQRSLHEQVVAWRRERGGTTDEIVPGSGGDVRNRRLVDLDPVAHPDAGNRTLIPGDRVRFEDGQTGVYMGTVGSRSPRSPTSPALGLGHPSLAIGPRELTVAAVAQGVLKVFQFVAKNWKVIATMFMAVATSPWGRVVWESYVLFLYNRIIYPLYSKGLRGVFSSIFDFLDLAFDFVALSNAIIMFFFNEVFRMSLCFVWVILVVSALWPFFIMINILSFGMAIPFTSWIWLGLLVLGLFFPYCPPEQVIENSRMTQTPWQYGADIIECFGDPDLFALSIGKGVYNGICSVSSDCPGNAPCICENKGGQFGSYWVEFFDDTPCGTAAAPDGQCLCWPKLDCQFLFGRIALGDFFTDDCPGLYGYRINDITWYQTADYLKIFVNAYLNFWISLRYITRQITTSPAIEPLLFPILIAISFLVLFYGSIYFGVALLVVLMGWQYALPKWTDITIRWIIPGLEKVGSDSPWPIYLLGDWILSFLRFPNHSDPSPLGSPGPGEGVCWFFNLGTLFGGGSVAFWFWATILALAWYGLGPILWFLFNNFATPFRIMYAPIWLYWQRSRLSRHFDKAKQIIRDSVPDWMRRGANTAGAGLWRVTSAAGSRLMPQPPDSALNRWITQYYPDPRAASAQHRTVGPSPTVIHGGMPGYGAGTLEYEVDPNGMVILERPDRTVRTRRYHFPAGIRGPLMALRRRGAGGFSDDEEQDDVSDGEELKAEDVHPKGT